MKSKWRTKRIGDIATIRPPKSEAKKRASANELVSFVPMEDLGIGAKYPQPRQTKRLSDVVGSYTYFAEGDVLLAKITPCFENGKLGIATGLKNGIGFGSSEFIVLRPGNMVMAEWLYYYFSRDDFRSEGARRMGGAVGHQRIPLDFVENSEVPIPPMDQQKRIVGVLDEVFTGLATARANAEKNLQNARALFESQLDAIFTCSGEGRAARTLTDLCEISSALIDPREKQFLDLLHVGGANIESKTGKLFDLKTAREEGLISGKFVFDDTTVLYSKIRPYLMKVARPDFRGLCSADIYPLTPRPGQMDRDYLFYLLLSKDFTDYANIGSARAGMPKVNREHLFAYQIYVPSVSKQKELASHLDNLAAKTQQLAQIYEQKQTALIELKKSLLCKAFNGKL